MNFRNPWDFDGEQAAKALDSSVMKSDGEVLRSDAIGNEGVILDTKSVNQIYDSEENLTTINFEVSYQKICGWISHDLDKNVPILSFKDIRKAVYLASVGTLVIILPIGVAFQSKEYIKIIIWNGERLIFGYVSSDNIKFNRADIDWNLVDYHKVISNYLHMLLFIYKNDSSIYKINPNALDTINKFLKEVDDVSIKIDRSLFSEIQSRFDVSLPPYIDNSLEISDKSMKIFNEFYNENIDFSKSIILPFTMEWFESSSELKEFYKNIVLKSESLNRFVGISGEGLVYRPYAQPPEAATQNTAVYNDALEKLNQLKQLVIDNEYKDPISIWLKSINFTKDSLVRILFISFSSWRNNDFYSKLLDGIGANFSLADFKIKPIYQILIHEINVNSIPGEKLFNDTHISEQTVKSLANFYANQSGSTDTIELKSTNTLEDFKYLLLQSPLLSLFWIYLILKIWRE
jgi:hypothetical protein